MKRKKILECQKRALQKSLITFFEKVIKKTFPGIKKKDFMNKPGRYIHIILRGLDSSPQKISSSSMMEEINYEVDKILVHLVIEFGNDVILKFYKNPSKYLEGDKGIFFRIDYEIKSEEKKRKKEANIYWLFD